MDLNYAIMQFKEKKFDIALPIFQSLASENLTAKAYLGNMLLEGLGIKRNLKQAIKLFKEAAEEGEEKSHIMLSKLYYDGTGLLKNNKLAFEHIRKAAEGGHAESARWVGTFYENGIGCRRNIKRSCEWFQISANLGDLEAQAR